MPSNVKITVVKNLSPEDIFGEKFYRPSGEELTKCSYKEGESFITIDGNMPEGFCHHAWFGLYKNVSVLKNGGGFPNWTGENMIFTACPDGIRPVIFKVERIED